MSDKLFKTLAYLGGAAAIYSGFRRKKKAERNRIIAQQATMRAQQAAFSATQTNEQVGPTQVSNADPSQGSNAPTGASVNTTITGTGSYQITADTNASLPILYGQCQVRGSVVDAKLENNTTLHVAMVIAERTGDDPKGDATYTLNRVFWNDIELELEGNGRVANATLSDGTVTQRYAATANSEMYVRLYEGDIDTPFDELPNGVNPTYNQMFQYFDKWNTADHYGRGALWALISMDYDADKGQQGLGTWTFDITNQNYSNPANVIHDYLTSQRYGHGYSNSVIDAGSFFSGDNSLRNISDELRFFTSTDAADDANVDITNSTIAPQFVTTGNSFQTLNIANSDVLGTISANTANVGATDSASQDPVATGTYNRLKILWAQNGNTSQIQGTGNISNCNLSLTSNNTFTAILDCARLVTDGVGYNQGSPEADVVAGNILPGSTYYYGSSTGNVDITLAPNTPITGFLKAGDRIRPEGSPYIYTVAEDVDVPSPGYRTFEIPVKERIYQLDIANTDLSNLTVNTPGANSGVYDTLISGDDIKGIYQFGTFPYVGATGIQNDLVPDALFSNVLIGNAAMSSPQEDTLYLGQEKKAVINGLLSTEGDVQSNLRTLLQHSDATVTWDLTQGKWKVLPNANADTANAFVFNDDNIIGEIRVTTSDLSNFYNSARASYVEKTHNSVKEEIIIYTSDAEKATNETPHKLEMNYPLTSSGTEATRKIEQVLIQNRLDLVTEFSADYSSITVEPGDIVKVTNADYGFSEKLFRVLKKTQQMDDDILTCRFILLEWDLAIFKERIGFKKQALDDIEFDPEDYDDKTDGQGVRDDTLPANAIVTGDITNVQIANNTIGTDQLDDHLTTSPGEFGNSTTDSFCIPTVNVDIDGRMFSVGSTCLGFRDELSSFCKTGTHYTSAVLGSNALQDVYNIDFSIYPSDKGDWHTSFTQQTTGVYNFLPNGLNTGNVYQAFGCTIKTYYSNGTLADTFSDTASWGADPTLSNVGINLTEIAATNLINLDWNITQAVAESGANAKVNFKIQGAIYYDGTSTGSYTHSGDFISNRIRD